MAWNQREIDEWREMNEIVRRTIVIEVVGILAGRAATYPAAAHHYIGAIRAVVELTPMESADG